ncbi:hypothetical protein [Cellulomonas terrae]|uniref:hypothetical protein n=1 Tax=Cellulomonas terrae TaxID=311234 RepID=UPI0016498B60|nr:hypothetical protein [Cellulomonas terrae]
MPTFDPTPGEMMATDSCPNCGEPTATEYAERHDSAFCSPITSPDCWDWKNATVIDG